MTVPKDITSRKQKKCDTSLKIEFQIELKQVKRNLDITTNIDNTAKDHRLRVLLPTDIWAQASVSAVSYTHLGLETIYSFQQPRKQTSINFDLIEDYLKEIGDVVDFEKHCMYLNLESEKTYSFLNEGLPFLANYCEAVSYTHLLLTVIFT